MAVDRSRFCIEIPGSDKQGRGEYEVTLASKPQQPVITQCWTENSGIRAKKRISLQAGILRVQKQKRGKRCQKGSERMLVCIIRPQRDTNGGGEYEVTVTCLPHKNKSKCGLCD